VAGKTHQPESVGVKEKSRPLDGLPADDLAEAKRRFAIIKPLVRCERPERVNDFETAGFVI
jgi:putative transposase